MFVSRLKNCVYALAALAVGGASLCFVWGMGVTRFPTLQGERTYYLGSASSQALMKSTLIPLDFPLLRGESVRFACDDEGFALRLIDEYDGEVLFTEEVDGVLSYYAYSPEIFGGLQVNGRFVNLHIAVKEGACAVGSPIIFGGF